MSDVWTGGDQSAHKHEDRDNNYNYDKNGGIKTYKKQIIFIEGFKFEVKKYLLI